MVAAFQSQHYDSNDGKENASTLFWSFSFSVEVEVQENDDDEEEEQAVIAATAEKEWKIALKSHAISSNTVWWRITQQNFDGLLLLLL